MKQFCREPKNPSDHSAPRPACTERATGMQLAGRQPGGDTEQADRGEQKATAGPASLATRDQSGQSLHWAVPVVPKYRPPGARSGKRFQQGAPRGHGRAVRALKSHRAEASRGRSRPASLGFLRGEDPGTLLPRCESAGMEDAKAVGPPRCVSSAVPA